MTKKHYPSDKLDQYIVRFPTGMRDRLKAEAAVSKRSLNAEIIARLEHTLEPEPEGEHLRRLLFPLMEEIIEAYQRGEKPTITLRKKKPDSTP